jgi:hypothetical protein
LQARIVGILRQHLFEQRDGLRGSELRARRVDQRVDLGISAIGAERRHQHAQSSVGIVEAHAHLCQQLTRHDIVGHFLGQRDELLARLLEIALGDERHRQHQPRLDQIRRGVENAAQFADRRRVIVRRHGDATRDVAGGQ